MPKKLPHKARKFDKYLYYLLSVQSPKGDVQFFDRVYKSLNRKSAYILCEDFCGTFAICCEWVKLHPKNKALGIDRSKEALSYGEKNHLSLLSEAQQKRVTLKRANVLKSHFRKSDIIVATNFSFYIFKERTTLKKYFSNVFLHLKERGLFVLDCFGGPECQEPNEEETVHETFSYFWDQKSFDPITNHAQFQIHFRRKGERKRTHVFQYDWRMWSIPEIKDLMKEVGFKKVFVYWEKTGRNGEGAGEYERKEKTTENCSTWVAYVIARV